jgi:hypothetical protein
MSIMRRVWRIAAACFFLVWLQFPACALAQPYAIQIQAEEWRDKPVRHLLIRGLWNVDTAFQIMLPERSEWQGRLFQFLGGGNGGNENAGVTAGEHTYALMHGGAYVESSQGHLGPGIYDEKTTPAKIMYLANYAVVQYAHIRCLELYRQEPEFTYVYGASGGAVRASDLLSRFPKLYDGAVAEEGAGEQRFLWYLHSIYEANRPLIQDRALQIRDQMLPGGSGDPFSALDSPAQKEALRAILTAGFPRNQLANLQPSPAGVGLLDFVKYKVDPDYYSDFWTQPGYAGATLELRQSIVEGVDGEVRNIVAASQSLRTSLDLPDHSLFGYTLVFTSGAEAGQWRRIADNHGSVLALNGLGPGVRGIAVGDRFRLDNRDLLAWRAFHRYIVQSTEPLMKQWFVNGRPKNPQRDTQRLNSWQEPDHVGRFRGKLITLFGQNDPGVWPVVAFRYRRQVTEALGENIDRQFRMHFIEHAVHGGGGRVDWEVSWRPIEHKALDDLVAWVEHDIAPAPSTRFSVSPDNQLILPKAASARRGYQPLVALSANGKSGIVEIARGGEVRFLAEAEDPDGELAAFEIDFEGDNKFDASSSAAGRKQSVSFQHVYAQPGTYFAAVRVTDSTMSKGVPGPGIQNLANIRVVVH